MTSVRDLLDVAAAELDGLSCRITLGGGPPPPQVAAGWSVLLPAAQHLIRQTVGPYTKVHRRSLQELDALEAPIGVAGTVPAAMVRAAHALGTAGDLLTTAVRLPAAAERVSLLDEGTRLLSASAEITLHGVASHFEHSGTMVSAADAGGLAHRLGHSIRTGTPTTSRILEDVAVPAPALPTTHPLGRLANALHEWVPVATGVVDKPALSSHDLRGVALIAGQLTVAARCLLALGPPDATSPGDEALDAHGRAWSEAARQWTRHALPGAADRHLAAISWQVSAELRSGFLRDGRWTSSAATDSSITPFAAARLRRSILMGLRQVADAHYDAVLRAAQTGWVATHRRTSSRAIDRLRTSRTGWSPATYGDLHPLVSAYGRVARPGRLDAARTAAVPEEIQASRFAPSPSAKPVQATRARLTRSRSAPRR